MRWLQIAALCTVCLTTGCALRPGSRADRNDWGRVVSLAPATELIVRHVDPRNARRENVAVRGRLLRVSPSDLSLRTAGGDVRISRGDARRVALVLNERDSVANGSVIGAAIGLAYGLVVTSRTGGDIDNGTQETIRMTTTGAGAAVGAWADALRDGRKTRVVYRRD
jgi:hypothetical protein